MKITKKLFCLMLIACMMLSVAAAASATAADWDPDRVGSLKVVIKSGLKVINGGVLEFVRVGELQKFVDEEGKDVYIYVPADKFAEAEIDMSDLEAEGLVEKVEAYKNEKSITGIEVKPNTKGEFVAEDLKQGLYLVVQKTAATGYTKVNSFLVSIPRVGEDGKTLIYDVDAAPKPGTVTATTTVATTKPKPSLPQTGQLWWPVSILAVAGLFFCAVGVVRRRKSEN